MVQVIKTAILAALLSSAIVAQPPSGKIPPVMLVSELPTCDLAHVGQLRAVTDGDSASDCSTGLSTFSVECQCKTEDQITYAWSALGGGSVSLDNLDRINFNVGATPAAHDPGNLYWCDASDDTLCFDRSEAGNTVQIGQELYIPSVVNKQGVTILNGQSVYHSGAIGQTIEIKLAQANSITTAEVLGLATHDILNNQSGAITSFGLVRGIDTSALTAGQHVYLSETVAGGLTHTVPVGPNSTISIGLVTNSHPTDGEIFVNIGYDVTQQVTVDGFYVTDTMSGGASAALDGTWDFSGAAITGNIGDALDTELIFNNAGTLDGSVLTTDGTDVTLGSGQLLLPDGAVGAQSIAWSSDNDGSGTGIYRSAADRVSIIANGAGSVQFAETQTYWGFTGTVGVPAIARGADTNTGIYWAGGVGDSLFMSAGGLLVAAFQDTLTPAAAPLSAMDDSVSQQVHIAGTATQADNVFEIDADGDGSTEVSVASDGGMVIRNESGANEDPALLVYNTSASPGDAMIEIFNDYDGGTTGDAILEIEANGNSGQNPKINIRQNGVNTAALDFNASIYMHPTADTEEEGGLSINAGQRASGTDVPGAPLYLSGGAGKGTGVGGEVIIRTATAGVTGSSLNPQTARLTVEQDGDVVVGTGQLLVPDGSSATPSVALASNPDTGFYSSGGYFKIGVNNGANSLLVRSSPPRIETVGSYSWAGDTDTYISHPAANTIEIISSSRAAYFSNVLTPSAAPLSAMDDSVSQQVHIAGTATQADNVFEVDADGDGTLTDGGMIVDTDGDLLEYGQLIVTEHAASDETIAKFSVSDEVNSYLRIRNGTTTAGDFTPTLQGTNATSAAVALLLRGDVTTAADTGTQASVMIQGLKNGSSSLVNRTVLKVRNYATDLLTIEADGDVVVGTGDLTVSTGAATIGDILTLTPKATAPATCSIGDIYSDTSGALCHCSATNTWEALGATGSCV